MKTRLTRPTFASDYSQHFISAGNDRSHVRNLSENHQIRPRVFSPISFLPSEIIHAIIALLKTNDVLSARLACRRFAAVGLHYLLRQVELVFLSSSFEYLREISDHPVLSLHIESLFYKADILADHATMQKWKQNTQYSDWAYYHNSVALQYPGMNASVEERRQHYEETEKVCTEPQHRWSEERFQRAYSKYCKYLADQKLLRQRDYNIHMWKEIMAKLPNLREINLSMECGLLNGRCKTLQSAFRDGLVQPYGDVVRERSGVPQLESLLFSADYARSKIDTLNCGNVHWTFFEQTVEAFESCKNAVRGVKNMTLYITTGTEVDDEYDAYMYHTQIPECARYLHNSGRLRDFVRAATHLERLDVHMDLHNPSPAATLGDVVGQIRWTSLVSAFFSFIATDDVELIQFYSRHATTQRDRAGLRPSQGRNLGSCAAANAQNIVSYKSDYLRRIEGS